jgi:hypothetical protein
MKALTCGAARLQLEAFHDQELPLAAQIAMEKHLAACDRCATELGDLRALRQTFSTTARARASAWNEERQGFEAAVLARLKAERSASLASRLGVMFEDMRLVYAGLGATAAAAACLVMMLNMTRLFADERPGSLAGVVSALAAKGVNVAPQGRLPVVPVVVDARMLTSGTSGLALAADSEAVDSDAEFSLRAVVTREGRVTNVELLHARSGEPVGPDTLEARALRPLVGAVARARFEPAMRAGLPVASNIVLNVPHTTVRPPKAPIETTTTASAAKKRATFGTGDVKTVRA